MKQFDIESKILIVGLGLLGGSYAKALSKKGMYVSAIDIRKESIEYALKNGIICEGSTEVQKQMIQNADVIVFALYPKVFVQWIKEYQHLFNPDTLITDVTGVKKCIVDEIHAILRSDVEFVAAHPMAGREVYGVENSDDRIFNGANYIVVPTEQNTREGIANCKKLGIYLGFARIAELSPEEHDEMIGFVSQLTHCIAISLMTCCDNEGLVDYTGDSFRDLTRIARINENMWSELFMLNKQALLTQMDIFMHEFQTIRHFIANGEVDKLKDKMKLSTKRRALFDRK
ncbi:MAG: prephenate dehydrogenase [Clostridia bacterium]|nr:prephenate dehydrogenase [Clostridia bacterium]